MPLYYVKKTIAAVVQADSVIEAGKVNIDDYGNDVVHIEIDLVTSLEQIPEEWHRDDAYPYGRQDLYEEKTVKQILEEQNG